MSYYHCIKTNIIVNKILEVNEKVKKTLFIDSLNVGGGFISHTMWCKVFNDNITNIITQINYESYYTDCISEKIININDIISLLEPSDSYSEACINHIKQINGYAHSECNSKVFIAWCNIINSIYMKNTQYRNMYIEIYNFIYNNYTYTIKDIINAIPFEQNKIHLSDNFGLPIILTKLVQLNIKLKEELSDSIQNTHIYNYILGKMRNFANLIDFGYSSKKNKEDTFNHKYISLNQIYDLFMFNDDENFEHLKTFLVDASIFNMIELVDIDDTIFSWNQLLKIINRYTIIDSINEKKYMKYLHNIYTQCILEILEEIHLS